MNKITHPIILETACGHDGKEKNLIKLIDIAKKANAKNIKFQIFNLEERALEKTKEHKIFKRLVLSEVSWKNSIQYAKKKKLNVFSDIYGEYSLQIALKNNVDGLKIHSEDFFNSFFIEKCIDTKKTVLIGIGGTHRSEIYDLVKFLLNKKKDTSKIILMPGVQTFPTPLDAHSLSEIADLKNKYSKYGFKIGYADHIDGSDDLAKFFPMVAYQAGAEVIEKHFTDDRKLKRTDYQSALNKKEVIKFVKNFDRFTNTMKPIGLFNKYEKQYRKMFKKSAALNKIKKKGELIDKNDLVFLKETNNPSDITSHNLINKTLISDIKYKQTVRLNNVKQKIGAIIVARTSSNRLPNKALCKINNEESIQVLIKRIKKIKSLNKIILATSTDKSDDILEKIAIRNNIDFFRGSLNNVALRYYEAAKKFKLDQILRITGDAILCDDAMFNKSIKNHLKKGSDVTFMTNMPYGTAKEIFNFKTIETIALNAVKPENTEYLEFFLENSRNFKVDHIESDYTFDKSIRLTLDYKDDLILFNKIFNHFKNDVENFTLKDVLLFLKNNPKLIKINNHHKPKFSKEELNLNLKI